MQKAAFSLFNSLLHLQLNVTLFHFHLNFHNPDPEPSETSGILSADFSGLCLRPLTSCAFCVRQLHFCGGRKWPVWFAKSFGNLQTER